MVHKSGFLRTADVKISGTNFKPKLPIDYEVSENIETILKNENKKRSSIVFDVISYEKSIIF
ncbi:hypothetical protein NOO24_001746 [Campylobacter jejuni]|uniref:hypothetical protein n=1 Tax=Campylobacter jejuni TaxID=197 RepID=UPI00155E506F|nr:hypothetical protein [Campylobacter jejuni]EHN6931039.1 hypothetical protein [Campylobacter jejuni]EHS7192667.1 hypothetical protein [Campylobacter jejuni]EHT5462562.1 hypothetical protein [Campylobacter jejuni]EHT9457749.1 hypothetical protein [Campylobacter jejuni]EHU4307711.1 hypothetical protein [Campylobacter jejuni]